MVLPSSKIKLKFGFDSLRFPEKPGLLKTLIYLTMLKLEFLFSDKEKAFGPFYQPLNKVSLFSWKIFSDFNPHHYGDWISSLKGSGLETFEADVVKKMIWLYKGSDEKITGMLTSGATEGNIFSCCLGKEFLLQIGVKKSYLFATSLTHQSVKKASRLTDIPLIDIPLNKDFGISSYHLGRQLKKIYKNESVGILICLTLGYKKTGTSDKVEEVVDVVNKASKLYPKMKFFLWIDGALEGLITPFISKNFKPFKSSYIKTFVVDFHKLAHVPYPSSLILFRKNLIKKNSPLENGLFESRTGLAAISFWSLINALGKEGFKQQILKCQLLRSEFLSKVEKYFNKDDILNSEYGITTTLILEARTTEKIKEMEKDFPVRLHQDFLNIEGKKKNFRLLKIYFLPTLNRNKLDSFLESLRTHLK